MLTMKYGAYRAQLYWPRGYVQTGNGLDFWLALHTNIRLVITRNGRGAGFELLGFGASLDWERPPVTKTAQSL